MVRVVPRIKQMRPIRQQLRTVSMSLKRQKFLTITTCGTATSAKSTLEPRNSSRSIELRPSSLSTSSASNKVVNQVDITECSVAVAVVTTVRRLILTLISLWRVSISLSMSLANSIRRMARNWFMTFMLCQTTTATWASATILLTARIRLRASGMNSMIVTSQQWIHRCCSDLSVPKMHITYSTGVGTFSKQTNSI